MANIKRIDDHCYRATAPNEQNLQFEVKSRSAKSETSRHLAEKAFKLVAASKKPPSTERFMYGGEKWKIVHFSRIKWYHRMLAWLFPFYHLPIDDKILRFAIVRAWIGPKAKPLSEKRRLKKLENKAFSKQVGGKLAAANYRHRVQQNISPAEFKKGVRAKMAYTLEEAVSHSRYKDPFTVLGTVAFQNYEKYYNAKDALPLADCDYRIIKVGDELQLVQKTLPNGQLNPLITHERLIGAMQAYLNFVRQMYGDEKVNYINHLYDLELKTWSHDKVLSAKHLPGLTPEHIYRFNIGTTNLEFQDIEDCSQRLEELIQNTPLETSLDSLVPALPEAAWRRLLGFLRAHYQRQEVTLQDLKKWKNSLAVTFQNMSPKDMDTWVNIFRVSSDDLERAYTGKKIAPLIQSAYTTAGLEDYKPWVDQQELDQTFSELVSCQTQEAYNELLAHIVVKKHLARRHPEDVYRVGALIPAPPSTEGGPVRWYKVTSCNSNQYSYSYTLEPVCADPTLPAIKLYRSTASSPYAMFSSKTVVSDFNPFNSPGYIGMRTLKPYEQEFFKERTIPVWVGYQYAAAQKLQDSHATVAETFELLLKSSQNLCALEKKGIETKSFPDVLKEHDAILAELFLRYQSITLNPRKRAFKEYVLHIKKMVRHYLKKDAPHSAKEIQVQAKRLEKLLIQELRHQLPPAVHQKMRGVPSSEFKTHFLEHIYVPMQRDLAKAKQLLLKGKKEPAIELLHQWNDSSEKNPRKLSDAVTYQLREITLVMELLEDLDTHVLYPKQTREFQSPISKETKSFAEQVEAAIKADPTAAKPLLIKWSRFLEAQAIVRKEDIPSKKDQDIHIVGHSLGGACAQIAMVTYMAQEGRIPLPQKRCAGYFFDDPAINASENRAFKAFGSSHVKLLKQLDCKFSIFRRQEAHDFIPKAGVEHLPATFSKEETEEVAQWCGCNLAVNERLGKGESRDVTEAITAHETRYLRGVSEGYRAEREGKIADYRVTYYDTKIQGTFDARGRKGSSSRKKGTKHYHYLYSKIWKLPRPFRFLLKDNVRKILSSSVIKLLIGKRLVDRHLPPVEFLDPHGNFIVKLKQ